MAHKLDHTPGLVPDDWTVPSNHLLGLQISASSPHMSLFLRNVCQIQNIVGYLTCSPVISNIRYDDLGSLWDGKVFNDISGSAEDFGRQWYNIIASRLAEKMWDNSVVTHSLLIVGSVYVSARNPIRRREISSP